MTLIIIVGVVGLMGISAIFNGYALSVLWGWFFVPTLGFPELSVVQAIGIALVVSFLTHQYIDAEVKEDNLIEKVKKQLGFAFFRSVFAIVLGWIVYSFM